MLYVNSDEHTLVDYVKSDDPDPFAKAIEFTAFLDDWKSKGTYSYHRLVKSSCTNRAQVYDPVLKKDREMLVFSSNNYLGLNNHPEVIKAAQDATAIYGSGMCGSRFLSGTYDLVVNLEKKLAEFEGCEEAMVFTTGYQANVGTISALMRPGDAVYIDKLCHASIIDGCNLSGCKIVSFRHNDVDHLEALLKKTADKYRGKLIVVDGVFSMDGDLAPLTDLVDLAEKYGTRIMVDEAHATGVVGETGRGTLELFDVKDRVDIVLGTFSKTLSATGGFIGGRREVITYVRHYGRSYMFSASPVPAVAAAVTKGLEIIQSQPEFREKLWENINYFYLGLKELGFNVFPDPPQSGIITIKIGPDDLARQMSKQVYEKGLFISTGCYPAVAQNDAKLRLCLSALHSKEDLNQALEILQSVGLEMGVI